ncbi:AAA family ATPase [Mangrovicoccus algicola]|uniref:AAA family ATPase n=1 Tax=Mangrovicoccus algicola TaxID=2771008 RepID=A0A8J6YZ75_9RHOB|nr:AAA family ATPase [Mangrovicoccus algicola]MBE3640522.1 AAA family ATPase [Mangrovicoccus algicola]
MAPIALNAGPMLEVRLGTPPGRAEHRVRERFKNMHINRLKLENFKGFDHFEMELNDRFTLIIGRNGVGKSSILDALSVSFGSFLLGIPDATSRHILKEEVREVVREFDGRMDFVSAYPAVVAAQGKVFAGSHDQVITASWKRELLKATGKTTIKDAREIRDLADSAYGIIASGGDATLPLLSYYGTGRLWVEPKRIDRKARPSRFDAYRNSHEPRVSSYDLLEWLKRMRLNEFESDRPSGILKAWRAAIESCFDGPVRVNYSPSRGRIEVEFESASKVIAYDNLSHGQRNILSMVGDIAYKAIILNPHLGSEAVSAARGVILIDEIDLHLHPSWQKKIIPALLKAFPRMQFVATTHSPFVIQSLSEGVLFDLDDRHPDGDVYNMPLDDIVEAVQKVKVVDRAEPYIEQLEMSEGYLKLLNKIIDTSDPA